MNNKFQNNYFNNALVGIAQDNLFKNQKGAYYGKKGPTKHKMMVFDP